MPQLSENTQLSVGQEDGSGLIELFNLNRLVRTINSIAVEAKDEDEMLQLSINALSIFTGFPLGHIYLRDAVHQTTFRCSGIHYVKYFELHGESHKQLSLNVYNESSPFIQQMAVQLTPYVDRDFKLATTNEPKVSFRVLIPMVSRRKLFGFFELAALAEDEEPNQLLIQVFHQIGYRIGSVLDSIITSREIEHMREEMISLTSHQLKAPLTAIKGNLELLKDGKLGTEEKGFVNEAELAAKAMNRLVRDLLNISKIEQGRIDFKLESVQVENLIDNVIKRLAPIAKQRKVRVEFKKPDQPLPKVEADPEYLQEALQNIISNAIDYTKNEVVIELKKQKGDLLMICNDNGIGIPKDEQSKIFEKFYRTSNAKQTKLGGTGLGLNIAKAIIEKFDGKIWFESEENKGTTFYVSLPFNA